MSADVHRVLDGGEERLESGSKGALCRGKRTYRRASPRVTLRLFPVKLKNICIIAKGTVDTVPHFGDSALMLPPETQQIYACSKKETRSFLKESQGCMTLGFSSVISSYKDTYPT
ncbi:hypothetical protein F2P81_026016 [Scophthalmus maximus]|uniref:Uncharacterized protein n=1 Tax=Scophthalmus maximus TaxID=52904 RepID=A0A6A4RR64_SCOMX|nr:hypothetical protein F2P81_026016 [Scophthalmus maximus]